MAASDQAHKISPAGAALKARIESRQAAVAVIGAGYVGLPLAIELARAGFPVVCIDSNAERVAMIGAGRSYIRDAPEVELNRLVGEGKIRATASFAGLGGADVIIACVPTPLTETKDPDISCIQDVSRQIALHLRPGQLISLESTTYPGTVQEVVLPLLSANGLHVGVDFFLCHSPERVDPGNASQTTGNTNKVVGGVTGACTDVASAFYGQIVPRVIPV
ncbi:MAG TPA: NAD(P)-binding domain-containing protein, partial [Symbiobacteriaceae bacterium]|nr:NAD(P)-binding domain-containing protein [Symbiobacteriaceae bacterium]